MVSIESELRLQYKNYIKKYFSERNCEETISLLSNSARGFGTGLDENARNKKAFIELFKRDFNEAKSSIDVSFKFIDVDVVSEDLGIVNSLFDINTYIDKQPVNINNLRQSIIFNRENGNWKIRHLHISDPSSLHADDEAYPVKDASERNRQLQKMLDNKIAELEKSQAESLFLTQTKSELVLQEDLKSIYDIITDRVLNIIDGKGIVTYAQFDLTKSTWEIKSYRVPDGLGEKIIGASGINIDNFKAPIYTDLIDSLESGKLTRIKNYRSEINADVISNDASRMINDLVPNKKLYCLKTDLIDDIAGNLAIYMFSDGIEDKTDLIEAIIEMAEPVIERTQAIATLRVSNDRYKKLVNHSIQGVLIAQDNPVRFTFASPQMEAISGHSTNELLAMKPKQIPMLIHEENRLEFMNRFSALLNGAKSNPFSEVKLIHKDGHTIWTELQASIIEIEGVPAVQASFLDVTEKKLAADALESSESKYRNMIEGSQDLIYQTDLEGKVIFVSPSVQSISGYTQEEAIGLNMGTDGYYEPKYRDIFLSRLNEKGLVRNFEAKMKKKDGTPYWVSTNAHIICDDKGKPAGVEGMSRDITELKMAEHALRASETQYRTLLQNLGGMVYRCNNDKNWTMEFVSDGCYNLTGYKSDELINNKSIAYNDLILPEYQEYLWKTWQEKLAKKEFVEVEYEIETVNGELRWVHERGQGIYDKSGELSHLEGYIFDITARKHADEELRISERRYRTVFESTGTMMGIIEEDGIISFANQLFFDTSGYSKDEVVGKMRWIDFIDHEDIPWIIEKVNRAISSMESYHHSYEFRMHDRAGEVHDMFSTVSPIPGTTRIIISLIDESDRKKAELAIKESEERLSKFLHSATEGFILLDDKFNYILLNDTALKIFPSGTKADDIIGKNIKEIVPGIEKTKRFSEYQKVLVSGKPYYNNDIELDPIFGSIRISMRVFKVGNGLGQVFSDITDQKKMESELRDSEQNYRKMASELNESNEIKDLLLDIISHDLKNPAGVIMNLSSLLNDEFPDHDVLKYINTSSKSLLEAVENAAILSNVVGNEKIPKKKMFLADLIRDIIIEYKSAIEINGLEIKSEIDENLTIIANPLIAEVFKNYIGNAIKYASEGKKIIIDSEIQGLDISISIADFGKTIKVEDRRNIFKRTFQLSQGKKRGRGLGLAIVDRIARAHDGEAWVEPNTPKGNKFCIKIPLN